MDDKICFSKQKFYLLLSFLVILILILLVNNLNSPLRSKTKALEPSCYFLSNNKVSAGCCQNKQANYCASGYFAFNYSINCKEGKYTTCPLIGGCDSKTGLCKASLGPSIIPTNSPTPTNIGVMMNKPSIKPKISSALIPRDKCPANNNKNILCLSGKCSYYNNIDNEYIELSQYYCPSGDGRCCQNIKYVEKPTIAPVVSATFEEDKTTKGLYKLTVFIGNDIWVHIIKPSRCENSEVSYNFNEISNEGILLPYSGAFIKPKISSSQLTLDVLYKSKIIVSKSFPLSDSWEIYYNDIWQCFVM